MNGAPMPVEVKNRCLSPEQAGDLVKTFGPEVASVNTECKSERAMQGRPAHMADAMPRAD